MDLLALLILLGHAVGNHSDAEFSKAMDEGRYKDAVVAADRCTSVVQEYMINQGFDGESGPSCYWSYPIPGDDGGCRAFTSEELTVCFRIVNGTCNAVFGRFGDDTQWMRYVFGHPQWKETKEET